MRRDPALPFIAAAAALIAGAAAAAVLLLPDSHPGQRCAASHVAYPVGVVCDRWEMPPPTIAAATKTPSARSARRDRPEVP